MPCPRAGGPTSDQNPQSHHTIRKGTYRRPSDKSLVPRGYCFDCQKGFSEQTNSPTYRLQDLRTAPKILGLAMRGVAKRQIASFLKISYGAVERKIKMLAQKARKAQVKLLKEHNKFSNVQFDDLQTFEHTKLKPLAIGLIVETKTRFVMGMRVSTQPSNGNLAKISVKKYGKRKDGRPEGWDILWGGLTQYMTEDVTITTDKNPMYPSMIKKHRPKANHITVPGGRGCVAGYGELKRKHRDPMFDLNHTCAMLRDRLAVLKRRTWATTKKICNLQDLVDIYTWFHNTKVIKVQE